MTKESNNDLSNKMNVLIALLLKLNSDETTVAIKKRKANVGNQARYLAEMGLNPKDIALILGAPITSIRTLLTPSRKK